jgi:hypothetical protein
MSRWQASNSHIPSFSAQTEGWYVPAHPHMRWVRREGSEEEEGKWKREEEGKWKREEEGKWKREEEGKWKREEDGKWKRDEGGGEGGGITS